MGTAVRPNSSSVLHGSGVAVEIIKRDTPNKNLSTGYPYSVK